MITAASVTLALVLVLAALLFGFLIPGDKERITDNGVKPEKHEPPVETDEIRPVDSRSAAPVWR